ncbi:MAG: sigma-70 family RNA polymerase sigma factor [Deltaproteobacteria bacterium]|nr:sigma-70 family RNA polymerase sigma factor [Deltaproteobacteria bacterium]
MSISASAVRLQVEAPTGGAAAKENRHEVPLDHLRQRAALGEGLRQGRAGGLRQVRQGVRPPDPGRPCPQARGHRDHGSPARRQAAHHRRALRRDEGAAERLLPGGGQGRRRGHPHRLEDPRCPVRQHRGAADHDVLVTVLEQIAREQWGRLLAALIRALGDFDLAEECLQEAFAEAVAAWSVSAPRNPLGWLYGTARHKAIDRVRRRARLEQKLAEQPPAESAVPFENEEGVPDERLRLIFTCCHPALSPEAHVALTLRTLCGLSTEEVAHAFLVPPTTMAQRLVRAKSKIREAAIPYAVPEPNELPERLQSVMSVVYLVFNEGYAAAHDDTSIRRGLCAEAIRLARLLRALLQPSPELDALLALMLLHDSRRDARQDRNGDVVLLEDQDRSTWDRAQIAEGIALVEGALRRAPPSSWSLEAAIAAVHAEAPTASQTDWPQIVKLYELLRHEHPSPVVALNHAVAVSMVDGAAAGLARLDPLVRDLDGYHLFHAARAELLRQLGRRDDAARAYRRAEGLARHEPERRFLQRRLKELSVHEDRS